MSLTPEGISLSGMRRFFPIVLLLPVLTAGAQAETAWLFPPVSAPVDFVQVDKNGRTLTLYGAGQPLRTYRDIQLGDAPGGHKRFQGDERTPEGRYVIDYRNPNSRYHLSLHISYPDARDRAHAQARGRSPGGDIFIHGQPNGFPGRVTGDWTDGCIAVSNPEIEDMWALVPDGTPIEILP